MPPPSDNPELRTWIFYFLVVLSALLWATFLLTRGEMLATSLMLALIATFMSWFAFIFTTRMRLLIFLYLITFVAILWATFLLMEGVLIVVSVFMYSIAGCVSIFAFLWAGDGTGGEPGEATA